MKSHVGGISGLMVIVIVLFMITGCTSEDEADNFFNRKTVVVEEEGEAGKQLFSTSNTYKAAENERFILYFEEGTSSVRMRDKHSGTEWVSIPPMDEKMASNNKEYVLSPVYVRFTEGKGIVQTLPTMEKGAATAKPIENGLRMDLRLPKLEMSFAIEYRVTEKGLEVSIPFDTIREGKTKKLVSLEILPFFEAASEQTKGAMVIPDGSGALIEFKEKHPVFFAPYSEFIYGGDHAFQTKVYEKVTQNPQEMISYGHKELAALPVFGIYKEHSAFLALVKKGDHNAKINATLSGLRNIPFYRASVEFMYRNDDSVFLGSSGEIPLIQGEMIEGERSVEFLLLDGEKSNYVGMAQAFRSYLMEEKGMKPVHGAVNALQLRLFGGVLKDEVIGSNFIAMTTFEQAKKTIDGFIAKGVHSIEVTYEGWSDDGIYGNQPAHFPADRNLGGNKELKRLISYAKEKDVSIYLSTNYVKPYTKSDALHPSRDAIRGLNKDVLKVYKPFVATHQPSDELYYYLKPDRVFNKYIQKESEAFAEMGVSGIHLEYVGSMLYSDPGSEKPTDRRRSMETWVKAMGYLRENVGKVAVDYGLGYVLGHVDRIDQIPLDSSNYIYTDRSIPFYQIAVHGLVPYTASPSNLRDHPRKQFLKALEYGALPSFKLTYEDPVLLKRTMVDELFSSDRSKWLETSIEEYRKVKEVLDKVSDQPIIDHRQLEYKVFSTTYGNGVEVIVNYGQGEVQVGTVSVHPLGYTVRHSEGGEP